MQSHKKDTIQQFIRFFFVGVSNTAVDFSVYVVLTRFIPFFGKYIYVANTISFICAAGWSYFANRTWTFKVQHKVNAKEVTRFYVSTFTGFLLNMLTLYTVVHGFGGHDLVGKLAATGVSMVWNFILNKLWVFKRT